MHYRTKDLPALQKPEKIFFIGIKGVGVCPLALIAKDAGIEVAGSDLAEEFITDEVLKNKNIKVFNEFDPEDVKLFFADTKKEKCLVVTTGAHKGFDNPQALWAKDNGINVLSQGQALGLFMDGEILGREDFKGVAIAGSHGKTTITSLLVTTLAELGLQPTYAVGTGELFPIGAPGKYGEGEFFIAEADEYASEPVYDRIPKFLYLNPYIAIFNNIDFDHPDLFPSISSIEEAFYDLALNIRSGGILILNGDDDRLVTLKKRIHKDIRIITYGQNTDNDYVIHKIVTEGFSSKFTVTRHKNEVGVFEINIPGIHNAKNALGVIAFMFENGFAYTQIRNVLKVFTGSKRRLETVGRMQNGCLILDDYGHHPAEIMTTIATARNGFPGKKLIAVFQPHTYSRTKALLSEFAEAFSGVDGLILVPIFKSQRDTEQDTINLDEYINAFKAKNDNVEFLNNFADVVEYMRQNYSNDEHIVLTIGAGDLYKIAYSLKNT